MANEFIPVVPDPARPPLLQPNRDNANVHPDIADADKKVRTGSSKEKVRDTPPSGAWNDTSHD